MIKLLRIFALLFAITGLGIITYCIISETESEMFLPLGLLIVSIANLVNIFTINKTRKINNKIN